MAKVGTSAIESRKLGYLLTATSSAAQGRTAVRRHQRGPRHGSRAVWRAPLKRLFPVVGRSSGIANIKAQLVNMRDGGFISAYDFKIASMIAEGSAAATWDAGSLVSEEYLMRLERKAFCHLIGSPRRTSASWASMLNTGKLAATERQGEHHHETSAGRLHRCRRQRIAHVSPLAAATPGTRALTTCWWPPSAAPWPRCPRWTPRPPRTPSSAAFPEGEQA